MRPDLKTIAAALLLFACAVPAIAFVQYGQYLDNSGNVQTATKATRDHLAATDGWIKMADGRDLYIFGFVNISSVVRFNNHSTSNAIQMKMHANFPGPTIEMQEGKHHYLSLSTLGMAMRPDLFDPHTVHFHGYPNASALFDGEPMSTLKVNQGADFTYFYQLNDPGTYMYHCHNEATEHMEMGMLGNLLVRPRQDEYARQFGSVPYNNGANIHSYSKFAYNDCDNLPTDVSTQLPGAAPLSGSACGSTGFDKDILIQFATQDPAFHDNDSFAQPLDFAGFKARYFTFNGRGYPDTANPDHILNNASSYAPAAAPVDNDYAQKITSLKTIDRSQGEQTLLIGVHNLDIQDFVTYEILGLPVQVVGRDAKFLRRPNGKDLRYYTNSILLGPGESADLRVDTMDPNFPAIPSGTYYLYSRNYDQLAADLMDRSGA